MAVVLSKQCSVFEAAVLFRKLVWKQSIFLQIRLLLLDFTFLLSGMHQDTLSFAQEIPCDHIHFSATSKCGLSDPTTKLFGPPFTPVVSIVHL